MQRLSQSVTDSWYTPKEQEFAWTRCLLPLSWLFHWLAQRRKSRYLKKQRWQSAVPVLVVGNIAIGGTGKTPVVAALVEALKGKGYQPGIISRGFGGKNVQYPLLVTPQSSAAAVGDEPVMLARQLRIPVIVDPDRVRAAQYLCEHFPCDLVIADDGLQHYNLHRHMEWLVMDGQRMLGNELCLPAGPLRELPGRMASVNRILINGAPKKPFDVALNIRVPCDSFYLKGGDLLPVNPAQCGLAPRQGKVHAVAGIGNPRRFFNTLETLGFEVIPHAFADHYAFTIEDIEFGDQLPVLMTAKDAVKCQPFADRRHWYLPVTTDLPEGALETVIDLMVSSMKARIETNDTD